jgi:hypothetical protein
MNVKANDVYKIEKKMYLQRTNEAQVTNNVSVWMCLFLYTIDLYLYLQKALLAYVLLFEELICAVVVSLLGNCLMQQEITTLKCS